MNEIADLKHIPQELKYNGLWCGWKLTGKGKEPFNLVTDQHAKSNDETTFNSYVQLLNNIHKYLNYDENGKQIGGFGLGIFRGYSAIDIDHCVEDGVLSDMAMDIVNYCKSYTEFSPSKTGIRIIFKTQNKIDKSEYYINNHNNGLEIYISDNTNKFVTITGNKISGDTINEVDIRYILDKYMKKGQFNIEKVLKKDEKLKSLWNKVAPGSHSDESETDMALACKLAYYLHNDENLVRQYFEMSPYFKSKDETHKKKWSKEYSINLIREANNYIGDVRDMPLKTRQYELNDTGNARRFIDMFGENLRYNIDNKMWMIWNGNYWRYDIEDYVKNYIEILAEKMSFETNNINDMNERIRMIKNIEHIYSSAGKEALLKEARHIQGIPVTNSELDTNQYLICTKNGTIDLKDCSIRESVREDLMSQSTICEISQEEPTLWLKTLKEIFSYDEELLHYFHKAIGYSISDLCTEQCMFILQSDGNSGKSMIFDIIRTILNSYAAVAPAELITEPKYSNSNNKEDIARLKGKRIVVIEEIDEGDKGNERLIKNMTSGLNPMIGKFLYAGSFEFVFRGKIWLLTNYDFIIKGIDKGIWRRIVKIPIYSDFTDKEDKYLRDKLLQEAPQILNWMLEGFKLYLKEGLKQPEKIKNAVKEYREDMDLVQQWINEYCEVKSDYFEKANILYDNYRAFCIRRDQRTNQTVFGRRLGKKFKKYNSGSGIVYMGLRLKSDANDLVKRVMYEQVKVDENI